MKRKRAKLLKILLLLFVLNSFSYFLYFLSHNQRKESKPFPSYEQVNLSNLNDAGLKSSDVSVRHYLEENTTLKYQERKTEKVVRRSQLYLKPWPILPSYLPWTTPNPASPAQSCEGYFGNGFTRRLDLLLQPYRSSSKGWFRCYYSETLKSSICEGGNMKMDTSKLKVSRGGEDLEIVMGRSEEEELPEFEEGAFEVLGEERRPKKLVDEEFLNSYLSKGDVTKHPMRDLIDSIRVVGPQDFRCDQWVEEPTLMLIRFEYANLFHTVTDWYSAYVASRVTNLPYRPRLVFVDGHCRTQLEETWRALFSSLRYAKHLNGSVCYRHAVFVPLGYETALFKGLNEDISCDGAPARDLWKKPNNQKTARLSEFGEMIRAAFGFHFDRHDSEKTTSVHKVLFVRREDYLAHPRHGGKVESRLSNEEEVFKAVQAWAFRHRQCKMKMINGTLAHMTLKDQVRAIQEASVIIGAHGAGLTHIVSATPRTVILEIISSYFRRPHFRLIAKWKGLEYHAINLRGSYASPEEVTNELSNIMKNLGC